MNTRMIRFPIALAAACALGFSMTALALDLSGNKLQDITAAEWAMAPPYCPYTMGQKGHTQPHIGKWVGVMGDGFFHMHHFCWALFDIHRAERADVSATDRRFLRGRALGGFQYVVQNTREDFILLPEIYTWIGRTEILLGHPKEAFNAFAVAQKLKPDYWPPYFHLAEFLQSHGQKTDAMKVVKTGLQYSPDAKPLRLLFSHLGGKPKDLPRPIVLPVPSDAAVTTEADSTKSSEDEPTSVAK